MYARREGTVTTKVQLGGRDRLVVLGVAVIGLIALLAGWVVSEWLIRNTVRSHALALAERVTEAAAEILDPSDPENLLAHDPKVRKAVLQLLERTVGVIRMVAFDQNHAVLLDSTDSARGTDFDGADVAAVLSSGAPLTFLHLPGSERRDLGFGAEKKAVAEIYVPIRRNGQTIAIFELYIDVTSSLSEATNIARSGYIVFAGSILAATTAILALVWVSLDRRRRDLFAIDQLRRKAEAMSQDLARVNRRQERFNADAAHELFTPLAILRARLDAMPASNDVAELKLDVDRMIRQVQLLLELARTESAPLNKATVVDLGDLVQDLAARLYPMARRMSREISVDAPSAPVRISGDAVLLESAIRNLLENALRVSPAGQVVRLVVADSPPRLTVADHGPGLDPNDLAALAEPFRQGERGGMAGLGLAIVVEAAKRLEAHLAVGRTDGTGGATFSLTFPG